jgi:ketosteroid isomerase-like protein
MRYLLISLVLFASSVQADTDSEIRAALKYLAEVWNEGDLGVFKSYYHSDFVVVSQEGPIALDQWLGDLEDIAEAGKDRGKLSHADIQVKSLGDDRALAWGRRSLSFKDGSGFDSWFTTVYVKTPFGWKAIHAHN